MTGFFRKEKKSAGPRGFEPLFFGCLPHKAPGGRRLNSYWATGPTNNKEAFKLKLIAVILRLILRLSTKLFSFPISLQHSSLLLVFRTVFSSFSVSSLTCSRLATCLFSCTLPVPAWLLPCNARGNRLSCGLFRRCKTCAGLSF